ncbi:TonB-dependent siderophore receptor [Lignipirellula cremea]|uniref:Ferrichrome-iron receptor n=1 Tax=Lignipirellula cremea TaxID=2528010 RepID=A0A518E4Q3_9BACT|nr:TonB-dependent siderophore receptor [Lignipirellula cremea]QDU99062.1 Ferrichrome-iron receptor precursor [Lignipirellula cremea]
MLLRFLRSLSALAVLLALLSPCTLAAQESEPTPAGPPQPPLLPETEVEAAPPASSNPNPTTANTLPGGGSQGGGAGAESPVGPFPDSDFFGNNQGNNSGNNQGGNILTDSVFSSPPATGYRAESSTTGSIINIPDADLPATVNVITRDLLDDQNVLRFDDVIRNAGGVTKAADGLFPDRIFLRGLEVGSRNFRKDGFLDPTFVPRDFQNVERVEILKGPASVLYGAGDPAGLVNIITKKPVQDRFAHFGFTFGSYDQARYTLDANGYGSQSGNVLYRLNIAQEDVNSFVDYDGLSRTQISPVVTWLINEDTSLTWSGEWHRHNTIGFQGTPAINGDPLFLPPGRYIGEPANDFLQTEEFRQSLVLQHQINDEWSFSVGGYSLFYQYPGSTTSSAAQVAPAPPLIVRSRNDIPLANEQSQSVIANLAGEFYTGELLHKAVLGVEYNYFDSASTFNSGFLPTPIDASDPTYSNPPAVPVFTSDFPVFRQQRVGGYLQDLVELNDYWKVLGGVRFDTVDFDFERNIGFGEVETQQEFNRVSPRGGVVYQPLGDEVLSFYYSYAQSFNPPGGGIYLNGNLQPVLGESHEAGIKTQLLEGLSLTASGFHITRQNDAFNVQSIVLVQVGEVRSQGAELNLVGALTDRWNVTANYTYTDARLSDPDPLYNNNHARNVPFNTANVWTRYNFYQDRCQTFGAALGLVYLGERPADLENTLNLPGYSRWDGGLYYRRDRWNASLYVENLFDVQYAQSSVNTQQIYQGAPLNARATVSYHY